MECGVCTKECLCEEKIMTVHNIFVCVLFNSCLSSWVLSEISKYKNIQRFKVKNNATKVGV